jgi:hypothetical protein
MKYIEIDSFGTCLHNKDTPFEAKRHSIDWQQQKIRLLSQYKFVLAFENSDVQDYITEKVYF